MRRQLVYMAARWSRRAEVEGYAANLRSAGHGVTSRWLTDPQHRMEMVDGTDVQAFNAELAMHDVIDVAAADVLVYFSPGGTRGGCHVEFGMALALGKPIYLVGEREHVFTWLPAIECFDTWADLFDGAFAGVIDR